MASPLLEDSHAKVVALADLYMKAQCLETKMELLETIPSNLMDKFMNRVQNTGTADDFALSLSYSESLVGSNDNPAANGLGTRKCGSGQFWARMDGENTFEVAPRTSYTVAAETDNEYWDQVMEANNSDGFGNEDRSRNQGISTTPDMSAGIQLQSDDMDYWDRMAA